MRSGYRNDFLALGENGKTIFESALQLREALRLRKLQAVVHCLAIPQVNDTHERIDWYAPQEGAVITWAAANDEQRRHALDYLEHCQQQLHALSLRSQTANNKTMQLFGSLLPHLLRFPGQQHIYLVDNLPVITFWGFIRPEDSYSEGILASLRATLPAVQPVPVYVPEPEAEAIAEPVSESRGELTPPALSLPEPAITPAAPAVWREPAPVNVQPAAAEAKYAASGKLSLRTALLLSVLTCIAISAFALIFKPLFLSSPALSRNDKAGSLTLVSSSGQYKNFRQPETLPLRSATVVPAPVNKAVKKPQPAAVKVPKNALVLPENSIKAGSIKFLNGDWRIQPVSRNTHKSLPTIRYHFYNGKGKARVVQGKQLCIAALNPGLMPSGNLVIKYHGRANCEDGSHLTLPEIVCHQNVSGPAECSENAKDGTSTPVKFRKMRG